MKAFLGLLVGAALSALVAVAIWPEAAEPLRPVRDGLLDFRVVSVVSNIAQTTGTHAEFIPKGRLAHLRLSVTNSDSSYHDYLSKDQLLTTASGRSLEPDHDAMLVKRQPDAVSIGAHNEITIELWYDVPIGDTPLSLRVRDSGDGGAGKSIEL